MTEETKSSIPNYDKPAKKAAKKSAKKSAKAKSSPSPKPKVNVEKVAANRRRVPMHQSSGESVPHEAKDPNFYYRWCSDYGKGKIQRYVDAGYEYVCYEGTKDRISKPGGHKRYLMRLPIELRNQDMLDKQQKVIDTNAKVAADNAPKGGAVPDYIPDGKSDVVSKTGSLS